MAKYRIYHFIRNNMFFWIEYSNVLPKKARRPIKTIDAWEVIEDKSIGVYAKICLADSETTFGTGIKEPNLNNHYTILVK